MKWLARMLLPATFVLALVALAAFAMVEHGLYPARPASDAWECQVCFSRDVNASEHRMEYGDFVQVTTLVRCNQCGAVSHVGSSDHPDQPARPRK